MPTYEFECNKCKNKFEVSMSVRDRENKPVACPECGSGDAGQVFSRMNFIVKKPEMSCPGSNGGGCDSCCHRNG